MYMDTVQVGLAGVKNKYSKDWPQVRSVMGDGSVRIRNTGEPFELRTYEFPRLTASQKNLIVAISDAAAVAGNAISFQDEWGNSFTGYIWGKLSWTERLGRFFSLSMTIRITP